MSAGEPPPGSEPVRRSAGGTPEDHRRSALLPQHAEMLAASGVSPEVEQKRAYTSVTEKSTLAMAGFSPSQQIVPGLLIPAWTVRGEHGGYQYRPDQPRNLKGRVVKYETPKGAAMIVNAHPLIIEKLGDPSIPLWITEGAKKADAAISARLTCVSISGVWGWRGTNDAGGKTALACWDAIALRDRTCTRGAQA
jgi:hypothetical protein